MTTDKESRALTEVWEWKDDACKEVESLARFSLLSSTEASSAS